MIKTLALIKRRASVDRAQFRTHYEESHIPLALPLLDGLVRYDRHHVASDRWGDFGFDVLTCFGYRDRDVADRVFARLGSEAGEPIIEDESTFMDREANRFFAVSERSLITGDEGESHLFVCVRRPPGMSRYDASLALGTLHFPRLLESVEEPAFALVRDAFPMGGGDPPYDCILQLRAGAFPGLESWSKSLESEGFRVDAVETTRFETKLPA